MTIGKIMNQTQTRTPQYKNTINGQNYFKPVWMNMNQGIIAPTQTYTAQPYNTETPETQDNSTKKTSFLGTAIEVAKEQNPAAKVLLSLFGL